MSRARFKAMTKDQLVEHAVSVQREREADAKHRAAIKRDLAQAELLQWAGVRQIDAMLGGETIRNLCIVLKDIQEAAEVSMSTPSEDTARVSHPDSSRDEGASTRRFRRLQRTARYRIDRVTQSLRSDLERDEMAVDHSFVNRQNALSGHHRKGRHGSVVSDCPLCEQEEAV